jgi:hypothetical protein
MWEWRVFFPEEKKDSIPFQKKIKDLVHSSPLEERYDYYYLINDSKLGLKERGPVKSYLYKPKLELKLLLDQINCGPELWAKPIKESVNRAIEQKEGLGTEEIITILSKYHDRKEMLLSNKIDFIINQFRNKEVWRFETKKSRKQQSASIRVNNQNINVSVEYTELILENSSWVSIQFKSFSLDAVQSFVNQYFLGNQEFVMGYPEFLLKVISKISS